MKQKKEQNLQDRLAHKKEMERKAALSRPVLKEGYEGGVGKYVPVGDGRPPVDHKKGQPLLENKKRDLDTSSSLPPPPAKKKQPATGRGFDFSSW